MFTSFYIMYYLYFVMYVYAVNRTIYQISGVAFILLCLSEAGFVRLGINRPTNDDISTAPLTPEVTDGVLQLECLMSIHTTC